MTEVDTNGSPPLSVNGRNEPRRRAPPRSTRSAAKPAPPGTISLPPKITTKTDKKAEKAKATSRSKAPDPNRETVITESGLALHPNGTCTVFPD